MKIIYLECKLLNITKCGFDLIMVFAMVADGEGDYGANHQWRFISDASVAGC
jgi:hypothetical protein